MSFSFNKDEFISSEYSFVLINQTSGIDFKEHEAMRILQLLDKAIMLKVPTNSCQVNHYVMVCIFRGKNPKIPNDLSLDAKSKEILFAGIGKVKGKEVIETETEFSEIHLEFTQFDRSLWNKINPFF